MEDERDAEVAVRKLDRFEFGRKGRCLRVEWTKQERDTRRSGGGKKPASNEKPSRTLFVLNFDPIDTKSKDLERHFEPYGRIANIRIRKNFAFIQFETQEEATKALEATNMSELLDRVITVEYAIRDDDANATTFDRRGRDREMSPERGGFNRRRSPSPYRKERGSPDYGRGRVRDSPDYGREKVRDSPDYGRGRNRGSPGYGRGRDRGGADGNGRNRGSPDRRGRDRGSLDRRGRDTGSPDRHDRDQGIPDGRGRDTGSLDRRDRDRGSTNGRSRDQGIPIGGGGDRGSPVGRSRDRGCPDRRGRIRGSPDRRGRNRGSPDHGHERVLGSPDEWGRERGSPDVRVRDSPDNGRGSSKPEAGEIPNDVLDESPVNGRYHSRSRSPSPTLPPRKRSRS